MIFSAKNKIGVIGLGYVGLPLLIAMDRYFDAVGFDLDENRIASLKVNNDVTGEAALEGCLATSELNLTSDIYDLSRCNRYIVTVPTPIDQHKKPDLNAVEAACRMIATVLSEGDIVILESTVYPGVTEEVCAPLLEKVSGLTFNKDFYCGYSPERVNPGDKDRRVTSIKKVTSGSTPEAAEAVAELYEKVIASGVFRAASIKTAEASKVIENAQRDLNVAIVNEWSMIFNRMGVSTRDVLAAANTKWNFLDFRPGLVGGHCIGVDPYYLLHKSLELGYKPELIARARALNEATSHHFADLVVDALVKAGKSVSEASILVLGVTFKENCNDTRNSKVLDFCDALKVRVNKIELHDPLVETFDSDYRFSNSASNLSGDADVIVLLQAHREFKEIGADSLRQYGKEGVILYDFKDTFVSSELDAYL